MAFVLVHGGSTRGACWERLVPLLEHPVLAVDLPGRGRHPADHAGISVEGNARSVAADMDEAGIERAIVVGHSMGGTTLVKLAELFPQKVARLVFMACVVPPEGMRPIDVLQPTQRRGILDDLENGRPTLNSSKSAERAAPSAGARHISAPEPAFPYGESLSLAGLRQGIPCSAIRLLRDTSMTPAQQDASIAAIREYCACDSFDIDAAHTAMFTVPGELAAILNALPEAAEPC